MFRCNAGFGIGSGHVVRCLTLAHALAMRGWQCAFAINAESRDTVPALADAPFDVREAETAAAMAEAWPGGVDLAVVDHYEMDAAFESALKAWARQVMVIDDLANRRHDCDLLLDSAAATGTYDALTSPRTLRLLGSDYALLRDEFFDLRAQTAGKTGASDPKICVSLGGTDPEGKTAAVLDWLNGFHKKLAITIVLGAAAPGWKEIEALAAQSRHSVTMLRQSARMAELLAESDLAIGGGGNSAWERAALGVPTLLCLIAENQRTVAERLLEAGAGRLLMDVEERESRIDAGELEAILIDADTRAAMQAAARQLCDGLGAHRAACAIERHLLGTDTGPTLRRAKQSDAQTVYDWQSHQDTRKFFRNPHVPSWEEHVGWFTAKLSDPTSIMLIAENADLAAAVIRLDRKAADAWEVSIVVAPEARAQGVGRKSLVALRSLVPWLRLTAEIHPGNTASIRMFEASGYSRVSQSDYVNDALSASPCAAAL